MAKRKDALPHAHSFPAPRPARRSTLDLFVLVC